MTSQRLSTSSDSPSVYVTAGREVLCRAADCLAHLAKTLDDRFEHAVRVLLDLAPHGRVVVSGVGKAGFIAQKLSATLASIGIPSFFLHPAEAVHGDLGRYTEGDIALMLSKSGETPEIVRVLPFIKRYGCPLIAMTAQHSSSLAQHADIVLDLGAIIEAGPLGLAPTTSTTAMLALGDALAMACLEHKGLTKERFASFHPGGNLGHQLRLVREIMRTGEMHCIVPETLLTKEVLRQMSSTKGRPGAASVVNQNGLLQGIFTDGDLRRCLDQRPGFLEQPIGTLMTRAPKTIAPSQLVEEALHLLSHFKIDQLIVVDQAGAPLGMVDIQDIVAVR